jgi:N-acetylglutamate synthase-like GNAT family acetyltransferase
MAVIRPFAPADAAAVQQLVLAIQRDEFGVPVTLEEQPDLRDVPAYYQQGEGGFWLAEESGVVVGTIGLLDIGQGRGALRKMFVAPSHRGAAIGVGAGLLAACLARATEAKMREVILGTTEAFRGAHRFYEKSGFTRVPPEQLPDNFPRMRLDTRFYRLRLG